METYIGNYQYDKAIRLLVSEFPSTKDVVLDIAVHQVKEELRLLKNNTNVIEHLSQKPTLKNLEDFTWPNATDEVREKCPWLTTLVSEMLPHPKVIRKHSKKGSRGNKG